MNTGTRYGEIKVTLMERKKSKSWKSVDLDTVKAKHGFLSFKRLIHDTGDHYLTWATVAIPVENVLHFETLEDKK